MKNRVFRLMIGVDRKSLIVKKDTKNAYKYINKIPCKCCNQDQVSNAEKFASDEMEEYDSIKIHNIQKHTDIFAHNSQKQQSKQELERNEIKSQIFEISELLSEIDGYISPKTKETLLYYQNMAQEIDHNNTTLDEDLQEAIHKVKKQIQSKISQLE